jgi:hypothetical protein
MPASSYPQGIRTPQKGSQSQETLYLLGVPGALYSSLDSIEGVAIYMSPYSSPESYTSLARNDLLIFIRNLNPGEKLFAPEPGTGQEVAETSCGSDVLFFNPKIGRLIVVCQHRYKLLSLKKV